MKIPVALEIKPTSFPNPTKLAGAIMETSFAPSSVEQSTPVLSGLTADMSKSLIAIAGQFWRLKSTLTDPESGDTKTELSPQEVRKASNAIDAIAQVIQDVGIRVIDRCNEDFHPGLPDQVVTEEPREGISKERIIRTIRPTIIWHQTMVQRGEIDIAVPTKKQIKP